MAGRNRPRTTMIKEDNGDEQNLWTSIVEKIKRCSTINQQYDTVMKDVLTIEEVMQEDESPKKNLPRLEELEKNHREGLKLAEEELRILHEEPDDLIKNLETLVSVRSALENETPRSTTAPKSRPSKRRLDTEGINESPTPTSEILTPLSGSRVTSKIGHRSGSVSASSIKQENGLEGNESLKVPLPEKQTKGAKLIPGAEVFYRNKQNLAEGEGILCRITNVSGEGKQRKYEIQDAEEIDEHGREPATMKAVLQNLIAIPHNGTPLPELLKGKRVLALYPGTTTFYKAELVAMRKDQTCRLRFEGEDDKNKVKDVDRRYVLDAR